MGTYVYGGKDLFRLEETLHRKIQELGIDGDHTVTIDAENARTFRFESVLMEADTFSLFEGSESKAVIVRNPYFLNASAKEGKASKKKDEARAVLYRQLESYLKQPNPSTELFFYCHGFDPDSRKKEYKLLKKYDAGFIDFKLMNEQEFADYASSKLKKKGISLDQRSMRELLDRCGLDTLRLHQALEKIDLYGDQRPTLSDIEHLVSPNEDIDAFRLSNMFLSGNLAEALKAYRKMLDQNESIQKIISLLAGSLRRSYNMKVLYEQGLSEEEIASRLHFRNKWAVHYGMRNSGNTRSRTLLKWLSQLADLDQNIKAGKTDPKEGFEHFLIENGGSHAGYSGTI
jgi:DNA polymerase-3 subunit delta